MTTLPEEAVTSAAIIQVITDLRLAILQDDDEGLAEHAEPMVKAKELIAKLSALPFLPVQGAVRAKELPWKDTGDSDQGRNSYAQTRIGRYEAFEMRLLKETIYGWSRGHGDEKADSFEAAKAAAQADFEARILSALEPSAARELALEALRSAEQFIENGFEFGFIRKPDEGDTALETLPKIKAAIRSLSSPDHADAGKVEGDEPIACVGEMQTSSGADYYVCVKVGGREITPHMFKERWKAEYEVAEWLWLFNGGEKPDLLAYGPLPSAPSQEVAGS
ncbi:hypothetical protein [Brucella intermedia]|uniref:hypothetical protein n=1 Tax=Brucella intermedia TaxID=94625 RepID=UPI00124F757C|nr:hypothetical protein [Brucella intermedia]KAB2708297.1 hypothetical protein F9K80_14455 [Brucella intermedia]